MRDEDLSRQVCRFHREFTEAESNLADLVNEYEQYASKSCSSLDCGLLAEANCCSSRRRDR
jgi:flagellar biosynthesis chaperone FliJ